MDDLPHVAHSNSETHSLCVELELEPRTYDIDFAGVVSNIVYVRWIEDLRLEMLRRFLPLPELMEQGLAPTLIRSSIDYKYPVRLFDRVQASMWLTGLGRTRWEVAARFVRMSDGKTAAEAAQTGVLVELSSGRPGRIPDSLHEQFERSKKS